MRVALITRGDFGGDGAARAPELQYHPLREAWGRRIGSGDATAERDLLVQTLAPSIVRPLELLSTAGGGGSFVSRLFGGGGQRLSGDQLIDRVPALRGSSRTSAQIQPDARADTTRLTLTTLKHAFGRDTVVANYLRVTGFLTPGDRGGGVTVHDEISQDQADIRARFTIVAVGAWLDDVLRLREPDQRDRVTALRLTRLVVPAERIPGRDVFTVPAPDGRSISLLPWHGRMLIGTAAAVHAGSLDDVRATAADVAYLLDAVNATCPELHLVNADVLAAFAELRPLVDAPSADPLRALSSDHVLDLGDGVFAVTRGAATTHRRLAERVVDGVSRALHYARQDRQFRRSATRELRLTGPHREIEAPAIDAETAAYLSESYGHDASALLTAPDGDSIVAEGTPVVWGEIDLAVEHEMAQHVADVLITRTGLAVIDPAKARELAPAVAARMAERLGWDDATRASEVARFEQLADRFEVAAS
jgi:glycerol-3-phosphate dehydrogenase